MIRAHQNAGRRGTFFRQLGEKLAPVYNLLEPVLGDRHADVEELTAAFEILTAFASQDPQTLRDFVILQRRHPPPPQRRGVTAKAASPGLLLPLALAPLPLPAAGTAVPPLHRLLSPTPGAAAPALALSTTPVDDGASIRLYDKLEALHLLPGHVSGGGGSGGGGTGLP